MSRAKTKAKELSEPTISQAEEGFRAAEKLLKARAGQAPEMPNVDLQDAGLVTIALAERLGTPEYTTRIKNLEGIDEVERGLLAKATTLGWASVHARRKFVLQTETQSEAKIPVALREESRAVRDRMMNLVSYHFDDHAELGPVVSYLRSGAGYLDRANDLEELADLYREQRAVVERDPKHYRSTDEADARSLAQSLYRALGLNPTDNEHDWAALQGELWPELKSAYDELRRVGLFLSRDESLFPRLITAVRTRRASSGSSVEDEKPADPSQNPVPAPT
jgi:hypothetical protein